MLWFAPFLLAIGAFITVAMQPFVSDGRVEGDALLMAWAGVIVLCMGLAFLIAGLTVLGVRSLLQQQQQQQTDAFRAVRPPRVAE